MKYLENYAFSQEINVKFVFSTSKLTIKVTLFLQTQGGPKNNIYHYFKQLSFICEQIGISEKYFRISKAS